MNSLTEIKEIAKQTLEIEAASIAGLIDHINDDFAKTIELILKSKGRLVISGIGKSANICQKIVATLNSTGTPAIFMHAADAIHGDLGNVLKDDIVICLSKSGDTPEIKSLVPLIKNFGNPLIAITGNPQFFFRKTRHLCFKHLCGKRSLSKQLGTNKQYNSTISNRRCFSCLPFKK